jgi:hypothetical protein
MKLFGKKVLTLLGIVALNSAANAQMQKNDVDSIRANNKDLKLTAIIDNAILQKNIFYGMNFGDFIVDQPFIELGIGRGRGKVTYGIWSNFKTGIPGTRDVSIQKSEMIEVDHLVGYEWTFVLDTNNSFVLRPMLGYYTFPNGTSSDCSEIMIKAGYSGFVEANFSFGKIFGADETEKGSVLTASIAKKFELGKKFSATANVGAMYNDKYFTTATGFSHVEGTATVSYAITPALKLNCSVVAQKRLSKTFENITYSESYGKIGLTYYISK